MRRISVRAIILHGGKLLCVKQKPNPMGESWCLPGGKVDEGEALIPALKREIIEELGVAPQVGALLYVQQFMHEGMESLEFFFHVTNAKDFLNIDLGKTTHGEAEIETVDFVDPKTVEILPRFLATEPLAEYAATPPNPVKIFSNI